MRKTNINYDANNDVLYISFGEPRPSYSDTYGEGIYIRYDMQTDELTGITILDFTKRADELKRLRLPGDFDFNQVDNLLQ